jgi:amino acid transporter
MAEPRREPQYAGAPNPDALLPQLDEGQLEALRQVGQEWRQVCGDPQRWRRALPVDPDLGTYPEPAEIRPTRFGRFVRVAWRSELEATGIAEAPPSPWGRVGQQVRRILFGPPLSASAIAAERMRKLVALPVLSADALSSVAYGPEAMLTILVLGGSAALGYSLPISAAIAFLMLAVGVSYRQTIRAYPHGGGSYIVATDNLGRLPGLTAAAGLATDYILTVAVSVAAGVAAIVSAIPSLAPDTVVMGVAFMALLLIGNLRGVRQAGALFAAPTYAFIAAIFALTIFGLFSAAGRGFQPTPAPALSATEAASLLLVLRAFASGATAMTGIEAISNAVPAFKPVEWRNARTTLTWMIGLLIALFVATITLVKLDGVVPNPNQTILSQLAHRHFGSGFMYVFTQASTAAILLLAANTAYNDFPRLLFLLARDYQAPRLFLRIGDRLTFSNGIILLSVAAALIYVTFGGKTDPLIPLYAVGVFLAFTMSQAGMVVHWLGRRDRANWRRSLFFNATGAVLSALVFLTAGITKFAAGAWVAVLAVGLFILIALRIRRHYQLASEALALTPQAVEVPKRRLTPRESDVPRPSAAGVETEETPQEIHHLTIVPIERLDLASMRALAYAASLQQPVLALHISPTQEEANRFRDYWRTWGDHLPLEVVVSPHRALIAPMVNYISSLHSQRPDLTITVIVPEIVVKHWWQWILHDRTGARLRRALRPLPKMVVTTVPFHLPR